MDDATNKTDLAAKASAGKTLGTADIARIMKLLPHRYPFLMLDRMYDMDAGAAGAS